MDEMKEGLLISMIYLFLSCFQFSFPHSGDNLPPKLVIEMLPDEETLSLFERIKNSFQTTVKRKSSDGSNSTSSEIEDRRDSIKSSASLSISSVDLTNRRASSASTFGTH